MFQLDISHYVNPVFTYVTYMLHTCSIYLTYVMYTVLILAHTIDNSFNKEHRIKHDLHLEVCHISNELDGVATCHH